MRKNLHLIAAGALAVGGLTLIGCQNDQHDTNGTNRDNMNHNNSSMNRSNSGYGTGAGTGGMNTDSSRGTSGTGKRPRGYKVMEGRHPRASRQ